MSEDPPMTLGGRPWPPNDATAFTLQEFTGGRKDTPMSDDPLVEVIAAATAAHWLTGAGNTCHACGRSFQTHRDYALHLTEVAVRVAREHLAAQIEAMDIISTSYIDFGRQYTREAARLVRGTP